MRSGPAVSAADACGVLSAGACMLPSVSSFAIHRASPQDVLLGCVDEVLDIPLLLYDNTASTPDLCAQAARALGTAAALRGPGFWR